MLTIVQGGDVPIVLEFSEDMEDVSALSFVLYQYGKPKKSWSKDDVEIDGNYISLPLTEAETLSLSRGFCELETKWRRDFNEFGDTLTLKVAEHRDTRSLVGGVTNES